MKAELSVLLEILEVQKTLQTSLVELSEKKTKSIASGNAESLSSIVEEEKSILAQIKAVEKKQSRCVERLAALLGMPVDAIRMSLIIEKAEGEQKESLNRIRNELSLLIEKQLKSNDINMKLLQMNMDYVQFLINTTSNQQSAPTYSNGGAMQKSSNGSRRLLDRKV
jgi:flagellar biosynthesis/type III secretory pathway chaperone